MARTVKIISKLICVILLMFFCTNCSLFSDTCENTIMSTKTSPNKKWKIVLFERSCGATSGSSSHISLLQAEEKLENAAGNIYIASGSPEGYTLNWLSDTAVKINGTKGNIHKQITQLNGVQLNYN